MCAVGRVATSPRGETALALFVDWLQVLDCLQQIDLLTVLTHACTLHRLAAGVSVLGSILWRAVTGHR